MAFHTHIPLPQSLRTDEPFAAEAARRHLRDASKWFSCARPRHRRQPRPQPELDPQPATAASLFSEISPPDLVNVTLTSDLGEDDKDVFVWAAIYENQRGFTLLSTSYYSSLSLFPFDPAAFTIVSTRPGAKQPQVSLAEYPLPDATWRWVSKSWMIDMRDDGSVQYDGWEYNWYFRQHGWRSHIGHLSAGGHVRRRRWVRLMMRPAPSKYRTGARCPPSQSPPVVQSPVPPSTSIYEDVWQGELNTDWARYQTLARSVGSDGRCLELWQKWLHIIADVPISSLARPKQWTEDSGYLPSEMCFEEIRGAEQAHLAVNRDALVAVLRAHGDDILRSFVFPSSRDELLQLLTRAGLLADTAPEVLTLGSPDGELTHLS